MSSFLGRFIGRPVFVLMVTLTIGVIGFISLLRLPLEAMPEGIAFGSVNLWIQAQNMNPEEVLQEIYEPLEGELLTIPGVLNVRGSCGANSCRAWVELSPSLDGRLAAAEVRDRLQRARAQWPDDVDRWGLWRETSDSIPLMFFGMALPDRSQRWFDLLDKEVIPKLEALEGVGQVSIFGMLDETVRIFFDRDKLRQLRLNIQDILGRLQDDNISVPVGKLEDIDTSYIVRADLQYRSLQAIRDIPIGNGLRLGEVADVQKVRSFRDRVSRVNGKYAAMGLIRKAAGANAVHASHRIRDFMTEIGKQPRFEGLEAIWMFDQGEWIESGVNTLVRSALQGGVLAFIVLMLFLRRLRMTLVITLSLPLSLLVALAVIYFNGDTLNLLSMAGLTLALGMLVDNSIVVLENIYRLKQKGLPWRQACIDGVREVGVAVFLATLTTVAVFVPILFAGDNPSVQRMLMSLGIPLCTALLASLFVALILLPATTAFVHRKQQSVEIAPANPKGPVQRFARVQVALLSGVLASMPRRLGALALLIGLAIGGNALIQANLAEGVSGEGDRGQVTISFDFERGTTIAKASKKSQFWEDWLEERRAEYDIENISSRFDRIDGRINVSFPTGTPQDDVRKIVKELRGQLPDQPGVNFKIYSRVGSDDDDRAKEGDRGFMVQLSGRDSEFLRTWAQDVGDRLKKAGLADDIDLGNAGQQQELRINVQRDRMQELGVDPRVLFGIVSSGLRGRQVSRFKDADGRNLRLIAEYEDTATMELADLKELQIFSPTTGFRRLGDMADFQFESGFERISRRNGVISAWVAGDRPENVDMGQFRTGLATVMKSMPTPSGYSWKMGGDWRRQQEDQEAFAQALLLGIVLVFLVMGVLFESVVLPLAVIVTLPFAFIGGLGGLVILNKMVDNALMLGLLILTGVIVNNGIVLLDHIVRLQSQGLERTEAILQGVRDRMRAILMTATTTIVGLAPMIFVDVSAQRGISFVGMATVVASGLFFGTFLTPILVPLTYTLLDDLRAWVKRVVRSARAAPVELATSP